MASHAFQIDTTDTVLDEKIKADDTEAVVESVSELFASIEERAADIIVNVFPRKILALNKLYESIPSVEYDSLVKEIRMYAEDRASSGASAKKRKGGDGSAVARKRKGAPDATAAADTEAETETVPATIAIAPKPFPVNQIIVDLIDRLKAEIEELVYNAGAVKTWININIPRIEDGNNFGVSVQEEAVSELGRAEDSSFNVMESVTKYYVTRGKLVSKVVKYPGIEDYLRCVMELDEKEYISLRLCCLDIRNNYCVLFDMINKNIEKLKRPRGEPHSTTQMY